MNKIGVRVDWDGWRSEKERKQRLIVIILRGRYQNLGKKNNNRKQVKKLKKRRKIA